MRRPDRGLPDRRRRRRGTATRTSSRPRSRTNRPQFLPHRSRRTGSPALPRHRRAAARGPAAGSRTSPAAPAGRRSRIARGLPEGDASTASTSTRLDRRRAPTPPRDRAPDVADRVAFQAARRRGRRRLAGTYDLVLDLRGAPRHVPPGRGAGGGTAPARSRRRACSSPTRRSASRSPRPATRSSGCMYGYSVLVLPAERPRRPAIRSATGTVHPAGPDARRSRARPASRASRSCPSSTTRSASTASTRRPDRESGCRARRIAPATPHCDPESRCYPRRAGRLPEGAARPSERPRVPSSRGQSRTDVARR